MSTSKNPEDVDDSSSVITPSSYSSGKDKVFSVEESNELFQLVKEIIEIPPINEKRIKDVLEESSRGRQFLRKFKLFQLENKIKYGKRLLRAGKLKFS